MRCCVVLDIRGKAAGDVFLGDADLCSAVNLWRNQRIPVHLLQVEHMHLDLLYTACQTFSVHVLLWRMSPQNKDKCPEMNSKTCLHTGVYLSLCRLCFSGAREGHLPYLLAMIHLKNCTPIPALLVCVSTARTVLSFLSSFIGTHSRSGLHARKSFFLI